MRGRLTALALEALLRGLAWLSFDSTQRLGKTVGYLAFVAGSAWRRVSEANVNACFPEMPARERDALVRDSLKHTGCFAAEFGMVWRGGSQWESLIVSVSGVEVIDDAKREGRGVLVLGPHFGNWEILNLYLGDRYGITAMYEPPRIGSLDSIMRNARTRTGSQLVSTTGRGIRKLYEALRAGRVVGILPDQVPKRSAGAYAPFFGRDALTMTLAHRIAIALQPCVVLGYARRLPRGVGFGIEFERLRDFERLEDTDSALRAMNAAIERVVRTDATQYQWEYKRFKRPASNAAKLY